MRFWSIAILGFLAILALAGIYLSIPLYVMGQSFAGRSSANTEMMLASSGLVFPIVIGIWFALMARFD